MNLVTKYATIVLIGFALASCGDGNTNKSANTEAHDHDHGDHDGHDHDGHDHDNAHQNDANRVDDHSSASNIALNNGEKWKVNREMKPNIRNGEKALKDYISKNGTDYKSLATELANANKSLISSCTMEGASHDALHRWLHPHLTLVNDLETASSAKDATMTINNLIVSYDNYHSHFQ